MHPDPITMSVAAAAHYIGVSRATIYRKLATNELPSIKISGRRLIHRRDLDALVALASEESNNV